MTVLDYFSEEVRGGRRPTADGCLGVGTAGAGHASVNPLWSGVSARSMRGWVECPSG